MEKKYELTDETKVFYFRTLHRIVAVRDFGNVRKGYKGGWIEHDGNLSHEGDCWVYDDAVVFGNASLYDNARVYNNVRVYGNARVYENACIYNRAGVCVNAQVYGNVRVYGCANVHGNAIVCGEANVHGNVELCHTAYVSTDGDYIVFKNWWSSGRYFTWTRSNNKWKVGCFYGSGDELIKKAYADSDKSGREYERIVRYVEEIIKDNQK